MKSLLITLFSLTFLTSVWSEDTPKKNNLPDKATQRVEAAKVSLLKNYKSEMTKILRDLEVLKSAEMKAGKLDSAVAIDTLIKDINEKDAVLTSLVEDLKNMRQGLNTGRDATAQTLDKEILGKWKVKADNELRWEFNKDGTGTHFGRFNGARFSFTWKVVDNKVICVGIGRDRFISDVKNNTANEDGSLELVKVVTP